MYILKFLFLFLLNKINTIQIEIKILKYFKYGLEKGIERM